MRTRLVPVLSVCMVWTTFAQQPVDPRVLAPGASAEGELRGGQAHAYHVELQAGQFVAVAIRRTFDVPIVTVIGPSGEQILESAAGAVSMVTATAGRYLLRVRANENATPPGPYEIVIEPVHAPTAAETLRAAADRAVSDGRALAALATAPGITAAIEKFRAALTLYREAEYRPGELLGLLTIGQQYLRLASATEPAREHLTAALTLAGTLGDRMREATARLNLGSTYRSPGERRIALDHFGRALALFEALGDLRGQSTALNNMGNALSDLSENGQAMAHYDRALSLAIRAADRRSEALIYNNRGQLSVRVGEVSDALEHYRRALPLTRSTHQPELELMVFNNTGIAYKELGDYRRSVEAYNDALALARTLGYQAREAQMLNNLGNVYRAEGATERALETFDRALALARRLDDRRLEGMVLNNLGAVRLAAGMPREALDLHRESLAVRRALGDRSGEASALTQAGRAWHELGDLETSTASLREALAIRRQLDEPSGEAETLLHMAAVERDRGALEPARQTIEQALAITETLRSRITDASLRATYIARVQDTYASYVDVLMDLHETSPTAGHDAAALEAADQWRARVLRELLVGSRTSHRDDAETAPSGERPRGSRASDPRPVALPQSPVLTVAQIMGDVLDEDTVLLEFALGEKRSWLWAVTPRGITSTALPARREIEAAARAFYEAVTARQPRPRETAASYAARVARSDRRLRDVAADLSRLLFSGVAEQLHGPWRGKRLAVVATGALEYLPFAALPLPKGGGPGPSEETPLVARHEVVGVPSASALAALRRAPAAPRAAPRALAVVADPVFEVGDPRVARARGRSQRSSAAGDTTPDPRYTSTRALERLNLATGQRELPRLPFSRDEAAAIVALAPKGSALRATDFEASRSLVLGQALADFRVVHFATHGLIDSERPELSGLILSMVDARGASQDGFLRLTDIYDMRLNADLVVLSACQTALGKEIKGEGLVGLTRGFMYAGVPRVIASLWQVSDVATAELMKKLYAALLQRHLTPAAALRAAQIEMSRDPRWASPYFWAGFVLQGEWR